MNDIRKDVEEEKELVTGRCKMPKLFLIIYIVLLVFNGFGSISGLVLMFMGEFIGLYLVLLEAIIVVVFLLHYKSIKASYITVTNKRIHGVYSRFLSKNQFSYKLDMIDNISTSESLSINTLIVNFNQGYQINQPVNYTHNMRLANSSNTFRFNYLIGYKVYKELENLLLNIKNERDLKVDIEMKKINVEERKASAFENMSNSLNSNSTKAVTRDYIDEIKELKSFLDQGIITQEEFDRKKDELLNNKSVNL